MKLAKFIIVIFLLSFQLSNAQTIELNYLSPKEYEVGGIEIEGAGHLDKNSVILLSGISVGEKIFLPSDKTSIAIDKLWKQGIFEDIQITVSKVEGKTIFLTYHLKTKPRLSAYKIEGVKRAEADKLSELMSIYAGDVVTENLKSNCKNIIEDHFIEKGFFSINTEIEEIRDTNFNRNEVFLKFKIDKGEKVRITQINIKGNNVIAEKKIRSKMKDTKIYRWWRIWKSSRFVDDDFQADKDLVISNYNDEGFRDARIVRDSVYLIDTFKRNFWGKKKPIKAVCIDLEVYEGPKFFFRDITWVGNTKYSSEDLSKRLRIQKGDPYNKGLLEKNLNYDPTGTDIYSLYTDDGYLFFRVMPTEIKIENDSIDIEMRVYEGKQARIGKVNISGNTVTNDYVVMRELRTYPGDLFSRDAVYRSLREIQQLGYFDPEKIVPDIRPNPESGTVDIEYQLVEKSSSQFDLSGGIGGGYVIFQAGISLNNFSAQKFFNKKAWNPFPIGDGQKLALRVATNGDYYHNVSVSFTEPWLGGKKPNSLSVGAYYSYQDDGLWNTSGESEYHIGILGASVSLATRLKWPDDYFTFSHGIAYQQYNVKNYKTLTAMPTGVSNNINYNFTIARNSVDQLIYPRQGSDVSLAAQMTFPYSLINGKDYSNLSSQERYKWLEYYKVNIRAAWYFNLFDDLVVSTRARFGFLGQYNSKVGYSPFERFYLGGDGLTGYQLDGRELVALRGYDDHSLSPSDGGMVFDKYTMELRYPITLSEGASVFALTFFEAGNSWANFQSFEPFKMYRSVGVGLRIFMPMFGMLGVDWGYGLDSIPGYPNASGSHFHISFGNTMD